MAGEKERLPYLPIDVDRLTSDELVEAMTTEEFGAYFFILCKAWKADPPCTIPTDDQTLAKWSRLPIKTWKRVRERVLAPFRPYEDSDRLFQKRLLAVRQDVIAKITKKKEAGSKGGKAKASRNTTVSQEISTATSSTAIAQLEQCHDSATVLLVANAWQNGSKEKDKDKDILPTEVNTPPNPLAGEPECVDSIHGKSKRRPQARSVGPVGADIAGIEVDGEVILYDADPMRWEAAFVSWWNACAGVICRGMKTLDTAMRNSLIDRLSEPDWHWKQSRAHFPLWTPSDWKPTLNWFLEPTAVSNILGCKYAKRPNQAGLFDNRQQDPTRVRTGKTSEAIRAAMAQAAAERSGACDTVGVASGDSRSSP